MTDVLRFLEAARRDAGLTQSAVARDLGMTQGHYSKVVRGIAPLPLRLGGRIEEWLAMRGVSADAVPASDRARVLAASIRRQCLELMRLLER